MNRWPGKRLPTKSLPELHSREKNLHLWKEKDKKLSGKRKNTNSFPFWETKQRKGTEKDWLIWPFLIRFVQHLCLRVGWPNQWRVAMKMMEMCKGKVCTKKKLRERSREEREIERKMNSKSNQIKTRITKSKKRRMNEGKTDYRR